MAKSRQQKESTVEQLAHHMTKKGIVFFNYSGLNVADMEELRGKLREEQATFTVTKRTLLQHALQVKGITVDDNFITGPVAVATADDEVTPAKVIDGYKKGHDEMAFYGGVLEEQFIDVAQVSQLAALPSKSELYAKMVGSMQAPISGFMNVLIGNARSLVQVLNAIKEKQS